MNYMFLMFVLGIFIGCSEDKSPTANQANDSPTNGDQTVDPPTEPDLTADLLGGASMDVDPPTEPDLTADLLGGASMDFVWIEPGEFLMGSPTSEAGRGNDETQHRVTLTKGFYLGTYEVTQGQWKAVMGTTPWRAEDYVRSNPNHPAVYVSWNDAQEFINKLNAAAGNSIYRLPTEAEWEYAARAGRTTRWSFGDDEGQLGNYAWYRENAWDAGKYSGQPVGSKLPNPWGLYDMHGNVYEWCQDFYDTYATNDQIDPQGPSAGSYRVFRGGGFNAYAQYVRSAYRYSFNFPGIRYYSIGFRLLRTE